MENNVINSHIGKTNQLFSHEIPKLYDRYAVPIFFEGYAEDIANRLAPYNPKVILEIASGTGAVTRALSSKFNSSTKIIATDINEDMRRYASTTKTKGSIEWKLADAMDLPFEDETFDAVVCQFGVMFFIDKIKGFSEVYRVLKKGGVFIFNVWGRLSENEFTYVVDESMKGIFRDNPPDFYSRIPFGYHNLKVINEDLVRSGFNGKIETQNVEKRSIADSPMDVAISLCEGTPLRNEILSRDKSKLDYSKQVASKAIEREFGSGRVDGKMKAYVVIAEKT